LEENKKATISRLYGDITTFGSQAFQARMGQTDEDLNYWLVKMQETWIKMSESMKQLMED